MSRITEKRDVQDQLINHLTGIGWTFIPRNELPARRNQDEHEPLLPATLRGQLAKLNGWPTGDARIDDVVRRLRLLPATLEGNEQFLTALRNHWTAYDDKTQREHNVILIDYDKPDANLFHFSEEVWFMDRDHRRMDMVLWVNGLPVALIENKSPKLQEPGLEGFDQVQGRYTTDIPEFIKYPMPFAVCAKTWILGLGRSVSMTRAPGGAPTGAERRLNRSLTPRITAPGAAVSTVTPLPTVSTDFSTVLPTTSTVFSTVPLLIRRGVYSVVTRIGRCSIRDLASIQAVRATQALPERSAGRVWIDAAAAGAPPFADASMARDWARRSLR